VGNALHQLAFTLVVLVLVLVEARAGTAQIDGVLHGANEPRFELGAASYHRRGELQAPVRLLASVPSTWAMRRHRPEFNRWLSSPPQIYLASVQWDPVAWLAEFADGYETYSSILDLAPVMVQAPGLVAAINAMEPIQIRRVLIEGDTVIWTSSNDRFDPYAVTGPDGHFDWIGANSRIYATFDVTRAVSFRVEGAMTPRWRTVSYEPGAGLIFWIARDYGVVLGVAYLIGAGPYGGARYVDPIVPGARLGPGAPFTLKSQTGWIPIISLATRGSRDIPFLPRLHGLARRAGFLR